MTVKKRLLISFAHPDDESFALGALIAKYVADGVDVYYLCATNGDVGTVSPEMLNGYNSIAELRIAELDAASKILGFKEVIKLGYKDSGMMNSDDNRHPDCLWYQWGRNPEEVTAKVTRVIREVRPHVIITFNRYGGYGHPDHIAIQQATVKAFDLAADAGYEADGLAPWQTQKLYYNGFPRFIVRWRILNEIIRGRNPRRLGRNKDIDMVAVLENIEPQHTAISVDKFFDVWDAASACHKSQGGGASSTSWKIFRKLLRGQQRLTRVIPKPAHDSIDENDLFAGVKLEESLAGAVL